MRVALRLRSWLVPIFAVVLLANVTIAPTHAAIVGRATLSIEGRSNATVSLAAGAGIVVAVWSAALPAGDTDIYAATSRDGGVSFQSPVRVNSTPGDARVNGEQPPKVTVAARVGAPALVTVVWTSKNAQGGTILQARSEDGGRTFSRSLPVPDGAAVGNRGWESVTADGQGRTHVMWLDHRDMAAPVSSAAHAHEGHHKSSSPRDGVAMAQQSKLYLSTVGESGSARVVTAGVCYCCKTAIATDSRDTLYLAWRHVYPGNVRDVAFAISRDGGRTFAPPRRVSEDRWQLDGCPDDGPAMTVDSTDRVHIAWPTLVPDGPGGKPSIGIFYAQSSGGQSFSARERLSTDGLPHHPQIVVNGERLFVAWDELKDGQRRIVLASRRSGTMSASFTRTVVSEAPGLLYPTIAPSGTGALVAWTAGGERSTIQLARME
ncbi:MAG: hypothetical protein ABL961_02115 [Vicinamibacterales bacterium]